ncbi:MAG: hypothetical protein JOY62_10225 [Acidobacteriaceae bacterium]|nr:hypothetical protein [Acidobacteriaceae bacterium]MBV9780335.1 hypothetical protein [Acidobacteriaceae bacterium]
MAPGQAGPAIAAAGNLVMASWTDATGLFIEPSTNPVTSSLTGVGFSRNGGKSFEDLSGLPNYNENMKWFGDPSVVAVDGGAYFIVSSIYSANFPIDCFLGPAELSIAVSVGTVIPNSVVFTNPIIAASGGDYCSFPGVTAFLDKPFMSYDPHTRTLAIAYTRFPLFGFGTGQIEVVTAHVPTSVAELSSADFSAPIIVWTEEPNVENTGAYPTVAYNTKTKAADIYVAWERNWRSNGFNGDPYVYIHAAEIIPTTTGYNIIGGPGPSDAVVVTEGQLNSNAYGGVKSLDLVGVPGYSAIPNDFPRIAWDPKLNEVAIVWNDASHHPLGDIFLRTFHSGLTSPGGIERLNLDNTGTIHMFPAVCFRSDGYMVTSWYDRRDFVPDSAWTDLFGDIRSSPYAKGNNFKITTTPTDWDNTASYTIFVNNEEIANFGDYTDNSCTGTSEFFTWTDGRLGYTQPFVSP